MRVFRKENGSMEYIEKGDTKIAYLDANNRAVISINNNEYIFGELNVGTYGFIESDIRYSYDDDSERHNFHIVPNLTEEEYRKQKEIDDSYISKCISIRRKIKEGMANRFDVIYGGSSGMGNQDETRYHRWLEVKDNGFKYLLGFQSLFCDEKDNEFFVSGELGRIQFSAFREEKDGPNFDNDGIFKMLYPCHGYKVGVCDELTKHRVYTTEYKVEKLFENENEIIKMIVDFILFINNSNKLKYKNV